MPDIQMCTAVDALGRICQVAHECYRHMAKPSAMQAWGGPGPGFDPKLGCEIGWPMADKEDKKNG